MPTSNALKGMHSLRTIQTTRRDSDTHKENSDYLKLFMLEKERTRLRNERIRLSLRLETLNDRLKEIDEFYALTLGTKESSSAAETDDEPEEAEVKPEWKTMQLKY
jgi:predicted nuclease with TOPRIM domain